MKFIEKPLFTLCLSILYGTIPFGIDKIASGKYDQVREITIKDFSKTKLFKRDSTFYVSTIDTFYRLDKQRIDEHNFKSVLGKSYPEIIATEVFAINFKYLLDTTMEICLQTKIPSRVFEKNGKLFVWRDKRYPLTDSTLKILEKFHLIGKGRSSDIYKFLSFGTDDAKQGATYFFCRSNLLNYKRVITNTALGYYDPPNIKCKK